MTIDLTIGELARRTATKPETVRYYEKIGLLAPAERTAGNYRAYREADLVGLSFIRRTRDLGFSIDQIRTLLMLSDDQSRDCATADEIASAHLHEIDRRLADLAACDARSPRGSPHQRTAQPASAASSRRWLRHD